MALQAVSGGMATLVLLPLAALLPAAAAPVSGADWLILLAMGVLGTVAHLLMTWSLRFAPSATLAPIQYLEIPCATLVGYLVFGALPNGLAAAGILVTIAAGLYVLHRERRASRAAPPAA